MDMNSLRSIHNSKLITPLTPPTPSFIKKNRRPVSMAAIRFAAQARLTLTTCYFLPPPRAGVRFPVAGV
ncbi:MAG: hypothetical protein LBF90_03850, partial [Prevotellaceae bacterium]|nr:hypothetical protein [Prevotellaceae bacterium]